MASKKGIITLTLVISRESIKPTVIRGLYMWSLFKVKTKIELQMTEYLTWKMRYSIYTSEIHKQVLEQFVGMFNYKSIEEVKLDDIKAFYARISTTETPFSRAKSMEAMRSFLRYFRKLHTIDPNEVTNHGVNELQTVVKNAKIESMSKKRSPGRPVNVAFIREVKKLKDKGNLGYTEIANILTKRKVLKSPNRGYVYRAYHKELPKIVV